MTKSNHMKFVWIAVALIIGSILTFLVTQQIYSNKINLMSNEFESERNQYVSEKSNLESGLREKEKLLADKQSLIEEREKEIESTKTFYERYIKASNNFALATSNSATADYYYYLASASYEDAEASWQDTIDYCVEARDYYSLASQDYNNAEALFKKAKEIAPAGDWTTLVAKYELLMDSGSKIEMYMYEACEYFETATLKYSQWSQYNDNSYKLAGDDAIDDMNSKIRAHDAEVPKFNKYLADINAILETMN